MTLTLDAILAARERIRGIISPTPLLEDEQLSAVTGARIVYKAEHTQRSGSFKIRGAYNKLSQLTDAERACGVIAPSAGNHAQGVALAAKLLGIPATIVMPERAPLTKVAATRRHGAEIILHGGSFDDAVAHAHTLSVARGLTFIHAFDDEQIIAGQGTIGLELAESLPEMTTLVVPIGGGGLIGGSAFALKQYLPQVRVIGVQAVGCAPIIESLRAGTPVAATSARTIADGIAVKRPGDLTLPLIQRYVDTVVTVDDDAIARAIAHAVQSVRQVVEGAGAAGLAAVLSGAVTLGERETVCVLLCGGNIDANLLSRVLEQDAVRQGRYIVVHATVDDRPGNLAPLISRVAEAGANIIDIFHRRAVWLAPLDRVGVELILEVRDETHGAQVLEHLARTGYAVERVTPARWPER